MEEFSTAAHIDEYVLGREEVGTFSASAECLRYARARDGAPTAVPVADIEAIRFERNTTLHHMKFLGACSVVVALVLTIAPTASAYLNGLPATLNGALIFGFAYVFALGAWLTAYDYLKTGNNDVIDLYIRTADEVHVICGPIDDPAFVHACEELIRSDIETTNRNAKLAAEIS